MISVLLAIALQSSTTCTTISGITRCNTQDNRLEATAPIDYGTRPTLPPVAPVSVFSGTASSAAKPSKARRKVGKLVAAGQCDAAVSKALEEGEFTLAQLAQTMCKPPPNHPE